MQMPIFKSLAEGYLTSTGDILNKTEKNNLTLAGKVITFEDGIRFLTDFLNGDVYYKVDHEHHNLDRCRTQFRLIESMIEQEGEMERAVEKLMLDLN